MVRLVSVNQPDDTRFVVLTFFSYVHALNEVSDRHGAGRWSARGTLELPSGVERKAGRRSARAILGGLFIGIAFRLEM